MIVKKVYEEHWDDYQLRSVSLGGNQPFFQVLKEYDIDTYGIADKYKHAAVKWYKQKHIAAMDDVAFAVP